MISTVNSSGSSSDTVWADAAEMILNPRMDSMKAEISEYNSSQLRQYDESPISTAVVATASTCNIIVLKLFSQQQEQDQNSNLPYCCIPLKVMTTTTLNSTTAVSKSTEFMNLSNRQQQRQQNTSDTENRNTPTDHSNVVVRLHPLLYEYMMIQRQMMDTATATGTTKNTIQDVPNVEKSVFKNDPSSYCCNSSMHRRPHHHKRIPGQSVTVVPLPLPGYLVECADDETTTSNSAGSSVWYMESTASSSSSASVAVAASTPMTVLEPITLPTNSRLTVQIIYKYDTMGQECSTGSGSINYTSGTSIADLDEIKLHPQKDLIRMALYGRIMTHGAILLLPIIAPNSGNKKKQLTFILYYYLIRIHDIYILPSLSSSTSSSSHDERTVVPTLLYRINDENSDIEIIYPDVDVNDGDYDTDRLRGNSSATSHVSIHDDCPGYETLQLELLQLLQWSSTNIAVGMISHPGVANALPSGILLTGCAGVGKTRLISSIGKIVYPVTSNSSSASMYHYISVQNLILLASWADEGRVMDAIYPSRMDCRMLVLDDLHILGNMSNIDSNNNNTAINRECRVVLNSIIQVIDQINNASSFSSHCVIIGLGRDKSLIPSELLKVGRLEKEVQMLPPSQSQREVILYHLLLGLTVYAADDARAQYELSCPQWAELLASVTSGCIASDLRRICSDAWCNRVARNAAIGRSNERQSLDPPMEWPVSWLDLSESVRNVVPSQLAMLDVTKPKNYIDCCSIDDWSRIHEFSWEIFAGYETVKKRIYRSVVVPWRRQLSQRSDSIEVGTIVPPTGILFHGPSGCGKTVAASCLGSSLGLPMIKVRAADVMDKWLGGSEATLRSLFTRARSAAPCILFFDEIDAIASNRANSDGVTADVMSRLLSTLLNEMDGISSTHKSNVIVVACTNRLESLDTALLRPGRLEEHIALTLPSQADAVAILEQKLALAPLAAAVDLKQAAATLTQCSASCADIEGICREAIFRAIRRCSQDYSAVSVTTEDIETAVVAIKLR